MLDSGLSREIRETLSMGPWMMDKIKALKISPFVIIISYHSLVIVIHEGYSKKLRRRTEVASTGVRNIMCAHLIENRRRIGANEGMEMQANTQPNY